MSVKCAEDPFKILLLPKASLIMGTFLDLQHTHPGISYWSPPPPPPPLDGALGPGVGGYEVVGAIWRLGCRVNCFIWPSGVITTRPLYGFNIGGYSVPGVASSWMKRGFLVRYWISEVSFVNRLGFQLFKSPHYKQLIQEHFWNGHSLIW